ncbi:hypothetical protein [Neorhizobium sp. IRS_2294]|uniref:hypothetical protein n=1 Tax=unclassified Neorhizobium TaxID=2629175 RepID=UPI003D2A5B79
MARKTTVKNELTEDPIASSSLDLEHAIDDLRGALKADEDGTLLSADPFASPASDFGSDSFGSNGFRNERLWLDRFRRQRLWWWRPWQVRLRSQQLWWWRKCDAELRIRHAW